MKLILSTGALILLLSANALAQGAVAFAPVTGLPTPLQSVSGRFSSLNPPNRRNCPFDMVTGRVVSPHLVLADEAACGQKETGNVLVNVELADPADAAQMVVGRRFTVKGKFISA